MKKIIPVGLVLVSLAACSEPLIEVTSAPVKARIDSSVPQERIAKGTSELTVRAFTPPEGNDVRGPEVVGATCSLQSDELSATAITPQVVILPKFVQKKEFESRGVPGALAIRCTSEQGDGTALVTASEKNATGVYANSGGGLATLIITTAVTAAVASSTPWSYPPNAHVTVVE